MEPRCKKDGDLLKDKEDDHKHQFEDEEAGNSESPDLLAAAALDTKTATRLFPS